MPISHQNAIRGCLLGCAVGDSIGLPYEGLSTRRARRFARLPLQQRFIGKRGMVSDDTDHSIFVLQALIVSGGEPLAFRHALGWRLRWWLLCLPAGIGMATLKGILRLWLGFSQSGVWSAGNGPSMRSAIIGAVLWHDEERRRECVRLSTLLTHSDPKALAGAQAISEIAARVTSGAWPSRPQLSEFANVLESVSEEREWRRAVSCIQEDCLARNPLRAAQERFATARGVSGYTLHSVPFALVAWYQYHGDYRATIEAITQAGGDVDTVAAIAGALAGTVSGPDGIPEDWLSHLWDWPHSVDYMNRLALRSVDTATPVATGFSPALFPRGLLFTLIVVLHGFRRLLPPY